MIYSYLIIFAKRIRFFFKMSGCSYIFYEQHIMSFLSSFVISLLIGATKAIFCQICI